MCHYVMSGSTKSFCVQWAKFFKLFGGPGSDLFELMLNI